jgi:hypothetical protein
MKAMPIRFAISVAALLLFGWMLWQQHPVKSVTEPSLTEQLPPDIQAPDLFAPPMPPPVSLLQPITLSPEPLLQPATFPWDARVEKPYAAPLPPNPHAFPSWEKRAPFRESQRQRGLYPASMTLDK